jgi:hypothetical protein
MISIPIRDISRRMIYGKFSSSYRKIFQFKSMVYT